MRRKNCREMAREGTEPPAGARAAMFGVEMRRNAPHRLVALLHAVNVGGTGRLAMADLRDMASSIGLSDVATYIASGNLVGTAAQAPEAIKAALEARLVAHFGKPVEVAVRTGQEMAAIRDANPFANAAPNQTLVFFRDTPAPPGVDSAVRHRQDEQILVADALGGREIYVHFPSGMSASKMTLPRTVFGTGRNMNTVSRLADMASS